MYGNTIILLRFKRVGFLRPALLQRITCSELIVRIAVCRYSGKRRLIYVPSRRTTQIKFRRAVSRISRRNLANFFSCTSRINRMSDSLARPSLVNYACFNTQCNFRKAGVNDISEKKNVKVTHRRLIWLF